MIREYISAIICYGGILQKDQNAGKGFFVVIHTMILTFSLGILLSGALGKYFGLIPMIVLIGLQFFVSSFEVADCQKIKKSFKKTSILFMYLILFLSFLIIMLL